MKNPNSDPFFTLLIILVFLSPISIIYIYRRIKVVQQIKKRPDYPTLKTLREYNFYRITSLILAVFIVASFYLSISRTISKEASNFLIIPVVFALVSLVFLTLLRHRIEKHADYRALGEKQIEKKTKLKIRQQKKEREYSSIPHFKIGRLHVTKSKEFRPASKLKEISSAPVSVKNSTLFHRPADSGATDKLSYKKVWSWALENRRQPFYFLPTAFSTSIAAAISIFFGMRPLDMKGLILWLILTATPIYIYTYINLRLRQDYGHQYAKVINRSTKVRYFISSLILQPIVLSTQMTLYILLGFASFYGGANISFFIYLLISLAPAMLFIISRNTAKKITLQHKRKAKSYSFSDNLIRTYFALQIITACLSGALFFLFIYGIS